MPPRPTTRRSPGRSPGFARENHRRGRSFEGDLLSKGKDDDLELFKEVQSREKENFLLQSTYDIDLALSTKFRYRSDLGLGFPFTVREEDVDILNSEGEKNDYDWLLTPPETPLFPSLDETPSVSLTQIGRSQTRPRSISRSYTMEKRNQRNRSSLSPCSRRPSSAPSSTLKRHEVAASQVLSGPNKPSSNVRRSSTLSSGRISTASSSSVGSSGARGTSPVRETRGNSASPKIRAWQSNFPGFSLDVPPNLRTSLADRPASYVRGSSPASRYSVDSASRSSNISIRSMSPAASRSVGSPCSNRRDQFSPRSKGSVTSSAADDLDSLQSVPAKSSESPYSKRLSTFPSNKSRTPKRLSRDVVSRSVPKGSFDIAARQMGHKTNQKMFRPLLSSVPNTSLYSGRPRTSHISTVSRNSSLTTSSYASSDLGTTIAPDTEGSDINHDDMASESRKLCSHEEIFVFDKSDLSEENIEPNAHDISHSTLSGCCDISDLPEGSGNFNCRCISEINSSNSEVCSKCANKSWFGESVEESGVKLCSDCGLNECVLSRGHVLRSSFVTDANSLPLQSEKTLRTYVESSERGISLPQSTEDTDINAAARHHREKQSHTHCSNPGEKNTSLPQSAESSERDISSPLHWNGKQSEAYHIERSGPSERIVPLPQSAEDVDVNLLQNWGEKRTQAYTVEPSERNTARNFALPESADIVDTQACNVDISETNTAKRFPLPEFADAMDVNSLPQPWSEKQSLSCSVDMSEREKYVEACPMTELLTDTGTESAKVPASPSNDMVATTEIETKTNFNDHIVFPDHETGLCELAGSALPENASHGTSGEVHSKCLTMEEATDVILYCGSIVHELVYKAASIVIDKERPNLLEDSHKKFLIAGTTNNDKYACGRSNTRRSFMPVKSAQVIETQAWVPLTEAHGSNAPQVLAKNGHGEHVGQVGFDKHPSKRESKCNCIVM